MIKVILIDDEQSVLTGLRYLIDWNEQGFELAGTFQDPREAIRNMELLRPELVITDIEMPELSGLDLIATVRELLPDSIFAILSAYDDFKYAQKAVQLGVFRYLLKPLSAENLLELLQDVKKRLSAGSPSSELSLVRSFVVREMLLSGTALSQASTLPYYRTMLTENRYQLLLLSPAVGSGRTDAENASLLRGVFRPDSIFIAGDFFALLLDEQGALSAEDIAPLLPPGSFSFRLSPVFSGLAEGHGWYTRLSQQLQEELFWGAASPSAPADYLSAAEKIRELLPSSVWSPDSAELEQAFSALFTALQSSAGFLPKNEAVKLYAELLASADEVFQSLCQHKRSGGADIASLSAQPTLTALHTCALSACKATLSQARAEADQASPTLIRKAKEFIQAHYMDADFRLSDTADALFVNYSYLSHLFKLETDTTLYSYLLELRMNQAKVLLANPALSINDVSRQLGYTSTKTFYSTFKKAFSQSPRNYQRSLHHK